MAAGGERPGDRGASRVPWAGLAAALVVAGLGWAFVRAENQRLAASEAASPRVALLDPVPRDVLLLVTADLAKLRASGVAAELLEAGRDVPGLGDVRTACGFDPVVAFDALALAVPAVGGDGDFGVVAQLGREAQGLRAEQILGCTSRVIEARGGTPATSSLGGFRSVRDVSLGTSGGEIAARPGGDLVLLGAGAYLRAMVDASEGVVPGVGQHAVHQRLRAALPEAAAVRGSVVLGPTQRAAIADEIAQAGAERAPPAVGRIGAAAIAASFDGDHTALALVLACDDPRAALEVAAALESARGGATGPLLQLAGLGAVVDGLAIEVERDLVHARVELTREQAEALASRVLAPRR